MFFLDVPVFFYAPYHSLFVLPRCITPLSHFPNHVCTHTPFTLLCASAFRGMVGMCCRVCTCCHLHFACVRMHVCPVWLQRTHVLFLPRHCFVVLGPIAPSCVQCWCPAFASVQGCSGILSVHFATMELLHDCRCVQSTPFCCSRGCPCRSGALRRCRDNR